jgi:hypothetical protein
MRKQPLPVLLAALSFLLCAFTVSAAPGTDQKSTLSVDITTSVKPDGSGTMEYKVNLSKDLIALLKSYPGFATEGLCASFFEVLSSDWDQSERESDGAITCWADTTFEELKALEGLVKTFSSGAHFTRLEIAGGHFYYDLAPNLGASELTSGLGALSIDLQASWIVVMPGEVVASNADETSGTTLTWDLTKLNSSSHLTAESTLSGGGLFGMDPTLTILAVIGVLGCCCLVVVIAGVAAFILLRSRKTPAAGA